MNGLHTVSHLQRLWEESNRFRSFHEPKRHRESNTELNRKRGERGEVNGERGNRREGRSDRKSHLFVNKTLTSDELPERETGTRLSSPLLSPLSPLF